MGGLLQEAKQAGSRAPDIEDVKAICFLLEDHKGGDVCALDLRELHSWTDFFIIATANSSAHLQGLMRHIADFASQQHLDIFGGRKSNPDNNWNLIDMGTVVIHLMSAQSREFYELEELWLSAGRIYPQNRS
jgi:ribosome-associated protein